MLKFLGAYKLYIGIAIVVFSMGLTIWYLHGRVSTLKQEAGQYEATIASYEKQEKRWKERISEQNRSIDKFKETQKTLNEKLEENRAKRKATQEEYEQTIRDLSGEEIDNSCEGAMNYLKEKAVESSKNE